MTKFGNIVANDSDEYREIVYDLFGIDEDDERSSADTAEIDDMNRAKHNIKLFAQHDRGLNMIITSLNETFKKNIKSKKFTAADLENVDILDIMERSELDRRLYRNYKARMETTKKN